MLERLVWCHKSQFSSIVNEVVADSSKLITNIAGYERKITEFSNALETEEQSNRLKGDMLEVLAAVFFERMGDSPRVGLNHYTPVALEEDFGVDGKGVNAAETNVVAQIKYRSNHKDLITYTDLSKTYTYGVVRKWIEPYAENSVYLFTNASGVSPACQTVLGNRLVVLDRKILCQYLNENKMFWANFIKTLSTILNKR